MARPEAQAPTSQAAGFAVIAGQVVDETGGAVPHAKVMVVGETLSTVTPAGGPFHRLFISDEHGHFALGALAPGQYAIRASKDGYAEGFYGRRRPEGNFSGVNLNPGERRLDVAITVWRFAAVSGVVVDEQGSPLQDAHVRVVSRALRAGRWAFEGVGARGGATDDRGAFRLHGLMPGEYIVVAALSRTIRLSPPATDGAGPSRQFVYAAAPYPAQPRDGRVDVATIAAGQELDVGVLTLALVPAVTVEGRIHGAGTDSAGSRSSSLDIGLRLETADTLASQVLFGGRSASIRPDGSFAIDGVPAGSYRLQATRREWSVAAPSSGVQQATVQTSAGSMGAIVTPPVPAAATPQEPAPWFGSTAVVVGATNVTDVNVTLRPAARLTGRVLLDGAWPGVGALSGARLWINVQPADGIGMLTRGAQVDDRGEFSVTGLASGRYVIRASHDRDRWFLKAAMLDGRDLSVEPFEVGAEAPGGVVVSLTSRPAMIRGLATTAAGQVDERTTVLVFPANPRLWRDYGSHSTRIQRVTTDDRGAYVAIVPEGDYLVMATTSEVDIAWFDPDHLEHLSRVAARVTVREGAPMTLPLRTQAIR